MAADVTLRKPIPIERELQVVVERAVQGAVEGAAARVMDGEQVVAEATELRWRVDIPSDVVEFSEAQAASENSPALANHPFPTCFVCGPQRAAGDGLRIFPGELQKSGRKYFAAPWVPDESLADGNGRVRDEIVWSALDCPTGFAGGFPWAGTLVTGRLGARLITPVKAGEKCVLLSWATGTEGRKHFAEAALLGEDGSLRAESKAIWIKLS